MAITHLGDRTRPDSHVLVERSDFQLRLADDHARRNSSSVLVQRMYGWRGYKVSARDAAAGADEVVLQACHEDVVFGTLSLCFDSQAGLAADGAYRSELDSFRRAGKRIFELRRLAIDPECGSKQLLAALFHLAYIHARVLRGATDAFIEVNPRHVRFYQHMLHFRPAGQPRLCERVSAIAVLLHLDDAHVAAQIARPDPHLARKDRSLYPFFFSAKEERGLAARLRAQCAGVRPLPVCAEGESGYVRVPMAAR